MAVMIEDYPRTLLELERRFASGEACRQYLFALRLVEGYVCPRCGGKTAWPVSRRLWQCADCRHQTSVTAGTVFENIGLPPTTWFWAMWYVSGQKNGVSALGL